MTRVVGHRGITMRYIKAKSQLTRGVTLYSGHVAMEYMATSNDTTVYSMCAHKYWCMTVHGRGVCASASSASGLLCNTPSLSLPACAALTKRISTAALQFVGP